MYAGTATSAISMGCLSRTLTIAWKPISFEISISSIDSRCGVWFLVLKFTGKGKKPTFAHVSEVVLSFPNVYENGLS